ncbi:NADH dehydrogenase [Canna indica]|uniref:NADH dehydrogenase n=1 Tax=Canna indica TaxID=4628 RepID=A0AAQ3L5P3_9LILI|nr:NADH dehydrogenase [Canna indica]
MAMRSLPRLLKTIDSFPAPPMTRAINSLVSEHTAKWMQDTSKKSPMELINDVPPIKVEGRIVACEGDSNPALGHPIEFICLDLEAPAVCKYCGLRYVQAHHH